MVHARQMKYWIDNIAFDTTEMARMAELLWEYLCRWKLSLKAKCYKCITQVGRKNSAKNPINSEIQPIAVAINCWIAQAINHGVMAYGWLYSMTLWCDLAVKRIIEDLVILRRRCPSDYTCLRGLGDNPNFGFTNFDTFPWSMLTTFQLITLDYWENIYNMVRWKLKPFLFLSMSSN